MPMKGSGRSTSWREINRWDGGTSWLAYPDEEMERASHALVSDGDVWLVDPVDVEGLDETLAEHGTVRGVVLLLDRHKRDAETLARRHEVPVYVPEWMDDVRSDLSAPVEPIRRSLGDSGYDLHKLIDNPVWKEGFLYDEDSKTLVVAEAVGTSSYMRTSDERLGVHPALRLKPPKALGRYSPERILVGHGEGVMTGAADALADALAGSRKRTPRLYAQTAREFLF
ncbi:hypothetical protein I7X12_00245 [Halosimplex litoreum]|uniref:MBL fold metallo-hydrolase n=1 Tax=Halosimplex litoreum TaxID=1198301 RepID=A0A7T3FZH2_9EURY|nr:hypothetical protein [Halosimplex litoreum]QPV63098.1 hypothetical protein I7X12_00245 [Halosimplex litoreum]